MSLHLNNSASFNLTLTAWKLKLSRRALCHVAITINPELMLLSRREETLNRNKEGRNRSSFSITISLIEDHKFDSGTKIKTTCGHRPTKGP